MAPKSTLGQTMIKATNGCSAAAERCSVTQGRSAMSKHHKPPQRHISRSADEQDRFGTRQAKTLQAPTEDRQELPRMHAQKMRGPRVRLTQVPADHRNALPCRGLHKIVFAPV